MQIARQMSKKALSTANSDPLGTTPIKLMSKKFPST